MDSVYCYLPYGARGGQVVEVVSYTTPVDFYPADLFSAKRYNE